MTTKEKAHTGNMQVGQMPPVILPGLDQPLVREAEAIVPVEATIAAKYIEDLSFMEEPVMIRIEPLQEKNPRKMVDLYVNGVPEWVPIGRPWILKRKYVEVLARSKPMNVQTKHETPEEGVDPHNEVIRTTSAQFPFSILRDDNPRGIAWLTQIMAEG